MGLQLNYSQVAFEADLPRIEGSDFSTTNNCQRHVSNPADPSPGSGCVNPPLGPNGPAFYPLYTTALSGGSCVWQQGGANIPGTTDNFGGSSTTEYGSLLLSDYPAPGFTITSATTTSRGCSAGTRVPRPQGDASARRSGGRLRGGPTALFRFKADQRDSPAA